MITCREKMRKGYAIHQVGRSLAHYACVDRQLRKTVHYETLIELLQRIDDRELTTWTFLLDESHFDYVSFDISLRVERPFGITDFKELLAEKIKAAQRQYRQESPYVTHMISDISSDTLPRSRLLGATGLLSFCLHLALLKSDIVAYYQLRGGRQIFDQQPLSIYPKSLYLIRHLTKHLHKRSFVLIYIREEHCQLCRVCDGYYTFIDQIGFGMRLLRSCYEEHEIGKYFYQGYDEVESNSFLKKLVAEAVSFFVDQLVKWMSQEIESSDDIIVVTDLLRNPSFFDLFQARLHQHTQGFVLPLTHLQGGRTVGAIYPSDLNALAWMRYQ